MNIQITQVNMRYTGKSVTGVQVYFNGHDDERSISLNGYIPLSAAEYAGNEAPDVLENLVRQKVAERVLNDSEIEEETPEE